MIFTFPVPSPRSGSQLAVKNQDGTWREEGRVQEPLGVVPEVPKGSKVPASHRDPHHLDPWMYPGCIQEIALCPRKFKMGF